MLRWLLVLLSALLIMSAVAALAPGMAFAQNNHRQMSEDVLAGDKAFNRGDFAQAYDLYNVACDGGSGAGCFKAGKMEEEGKGVAKSLKAAGLLYEYACTNEYLLGCVRAGFLYSGNAVAGETLPTNDGRAVELYEFACERQNAAACANLSFMSRLGRGTPKDLAKSADLALTACEGGSPTGCSMYADRLAHGEGRPVNPEQATAFYRRGCDGGLTFACDRLAAVSGKAPAKPAASAAAAPARPAAPQADYRAGLEAFDRDQFPAAYRILRPYADRGDTTAEYTVGFMHAYGAGANRDYLEAARFLVRAARKGDKRAEELLGIIGPNIKQAQFVYMIDTEGPDMSTLSNFSYEVAVYCQFRGPNCTTWRKRYQQAERANNQRAFAEQMGRAWRQAAPDARFGNDPRRGGETFGACVRRQARTRGVTAGTTLLDFDCF